MFNFRKSVLAVSVSALAVMAAAPAFAQDNTAVEEVVVTGIRASLLQSIESKRRADAIVDVVTAEDVGKFPSSNVAEALTIVPGVTVDRAFGQGEKVSILGTDPALNRTLLNGQTVASADWFILILRVARSTTPFWPRRSSARSRSSSRPKRASTKAASAARSSSTPASRWI